MTSTEEILKSLRKKYPENLVYTLTDFVAEPVESIPSGSISFDIESGIGGIPRGRAIEIFGAESSGKSTLCQHMVANAQEKGILCAYIDTEQSLDLGYAQKCGVDINNLVISQPDTFEMALNLTEDLIVQPEIGLIIFDSVVGISPEKEKEDNLEDRNVSLIASLLTKFFRRNVYQLRDTKTSLVMTNQVRDSIGTYIKHFDTTGGHALKHFAAMRIQTSKVGEVKDGSDIIAAEIKAVFRKNKLGPPYRTANFEIYFDKGIWKPADILKNSIDRGIIKTRGSYFVYEGETIAQGKVNTLNKFSESPELLSTIESELLKHIGE